jgi:hypothetical protein
MDNALMGGMNGQCINGRDELTVDKGRDELTMNKWSNGLAVNK